MSCLSLWSCFRVRYKPSIPSELLVSSPQPDQSKEDYVNRSHEKVRIPEISIERINKVTTNFGSNNRLDGSYGRVYYGVLRDGTEEAIEVAFKKITPSDNQDVQEFYSQISTISKFKHDNIVKIVGYCVVDALWILAIEYANSRSLYDSLHGQRGVTIDKPDKVLAWNHRVKIAYGVAKALYYLHEKVEPPMRHGNIKSSNVLLLTRDDGDVNAKLSDLRPPINHATESMLHSNVLGSFGYDAPEFAMTGKLTIKSDTYSFGVILLELLTGRKPIDRSLEKGKHSLVTWCTPMLKDRLRECMDPRLEGNYDTKSAIKIAAIASLCVQFDAAFRPNTGDILRAIRSLTI